jgi:sirohydrochlorin cobaltochelatase
VGELQNRHLFGTVRAAFLKEPPCIADALKGIEERDVYVVPFFISEGYFCEEVVPHQLGMPQKEENGFSRVKRSGHQTIHYCKPVGTSARMTQVILSRARGVVAQHPFPRQPQENDITLVIAGHGTPLNTDSRRSIENQVASIREAGLYDSVHPAFMEEEPKIADCWDQATTRNIVMVPFFLSDGLHVREDIPVLLGEPAERVKERLLKGGPTWKNPTERHGKLLWYSSAVGTDPVQVEVVLERVREMVGGEG